jgi:hypothetical protein
MEQQKKKYTVNGVGYDSLDEIPEDKRKSIEEFEMMCKAADKGGDEFLHLMKLRAENAAKNKLPIDDGSGDSAYAREEKGFIRSWQFRAMISMLILAGLLYLIFRM